MEYGKFLTWLKADKGLAERSAKDVVSRLKRAMTLIDDKNVTENTLQLLNASPKFLALSMSVKSQLRRSVSLYSEFDK